MSVIQKQINVNEDSVCDDFNRKIKLKSTITPDDVLKLTKITDDFLCDNINEYQIEFTRFKIRDLETDTTLFDISKDTTAAVASDMNSHHTDGNNTNTQDNSEKEPIDPDSGRFVRYLFSKSFLSLKHIGAT